jgi:hypothetical protein
VVSSRSCPVFSATGEKEMDDLWDNTNPSFLFLYSFFFFSTRRLEWIDTSVSFPRLYVDKNIADKAQLKIIPATSLSLLSDILFDTC